MNTMFRNIILALLLLTFSELLLAIPAKYVMKKVKQEDGTELTIYLHGDEFFHCYVTEDYLPVIESGESYYYAVVEKGKLIKSDLLAHNYSLRSEDEKTICNKNKQKIWKDIEDIRDLAKNERQPAKGVRTAKVATKDEPFVGKRKALAILVNFADMNMASPEPYEEYDMMFNMEGYSKYGHIGSVSDYFYDQSYGNFELEFDVVGPITVNKGYSYYGQNVSGNDAKVYEMVVEACTIADKHVDFNDYDWNKDGVADLVYLIYAGYGENEGAPSETIWPHKSGISYYEDEIGLLRLDGIIIDTYACSSELDGSTGKKPNGIGTICHEFTHCLGLPDIYDVRYNGGFGMDIWDIMSGGSYNGPEGNGEIPCGYSAFERYLLGWLDLVELEGPCIIEEMPSLGDAGIAYAIYNDNNRNEFFTLENRQNKDWFSYAGTINTAHGLLVTHIHYDKKRWENNTVNTTPDHQRMCIVPADNSFGVLYESGGNKRYHVSDKELLGDLFPGSNNVKMLSDFSHKSSGVELFSKNVDGSYELGKPISNIEEKNGYIYFDFMGGVAEPIAVVDKATEISDDGFKANWKELDNAINYTLELKGVTNFEIAINNVLLNEVFTGNKNVDESKNISSTLDDYTTDTGWKGGNVYLLDTGLMIGDSTAGSYITTPMINVEKGDLTAKISFCSYCKKKTDIKLLLMSVYASSFSEYTLESDTVFASKTVPLPALDKGMYKLKIECSGATVIKNIALYDGAYTSNDLNPLSQNTSNIYKETIEGINDTYYFFDNLEEKHYKYRVKATLGSGTSKWSRYEYVTLSYPLGIKDSAHDSSNEKEEYYTISGIRIESPSTPGIYIRRKGNKFEKIAVN